ASDVLTDLDAAVPSGPARPRAAGRRPLVAAVALVAVIAASALFVTRDRRAATAAEASIAVLPFLNLSEEEQQYFSDGVTEEILNALARIDGLRVPARTSSFHFRDRDLPVREIAEQLRVAHVLEGSVRRDGEDVRITATLVDARTERRLWSETFEAESRDVFDVQRRIADAVAAALELRLAPGAARADGAPAVAAAHDLYLQGLFHWNRRSRAELLNAIRLFEEAVAVDSAYARAWGGLALAYAAGIASIPPLLADTPLLPRVEAAAQRALALDSTLAEPHAALGYAYHWQWRWADAERELRRALVLNPSWASALHWYGEHLAKIGRGEEAESWLRRAIALDPFALVLQSDLGLVLAHDGRVSEAIAQYERARERDPGFVIPHLMLHRLYLVRGDIEESVEAGRRWAELSTAADAVELATLARAKTDPELRSAALAILDRWETGPAPFWPDIALYATQLGEHERALDALEQALRQRMPMLANLRQASWFEPLHGHPRYERLIAALRFP
ncbi:MAG TPA: tetratricopeptide repeat protein, partial [Candidatus Limnocylindria bacterium]|nr:tetratricopeptide repeat protein [Candidatus Limnocylindria bacterium]